MTITKDQYLTLVRTMLNFGGGLAVGHGFVSDSDLGSIIGVVTMVATAAWGMFVHTPANIVAAAEVVKEKGLA